MLIDVTIDIRDLDVTGAAPAHATIRIARLNPVTIDGVLVTSAPVPIALTDGHGSVQLEADTAYRVTTSGIAGVRSSFAILTPTAATTLAELWHTGQIDPSDFAAMPVPQTVEQVLAEQSAYNAATYATKEELAAGGGGGSGPGGQVLTQASPSASWIFTHVLGRIPVVAVYDTGGQQIAPDVHASATSLSLVFAAPTAGVAVLT